MFILYRFTGAYKFTRGFNLMMMKKIVNKKLAVPFQ